MQAPTSFGLIGGIVFLAALAIALAVAASAVLAVPIFLVALIAFLLWRGRERTKPPLNRRSSARVPTTEEAAADPAGDSGVRDAARSSTKHPT
jgi:membrane protein implicated in regulation of membrane protease activity